MTPDLEWVAKVSEPALEPELPIVDPHHHLWQRAGNDYMFHDLLADTQTGHNIVGHRLRLTQRLRRPRRTNPTPGLMAGKTRHVQALDRGLHRIGRR